MMQSYFWNLKQFLLTKTVLMRIKFHNNIFKVKVPTSMIDLNNLFAVICRDKAVQDHFQDISELRPKLYHLDQVS